MRPSRPWIALYASLVLLVPLWTLWGMTRPDPAPAVADTVDAEARLQGVWWRYGSRAEGDPVRFYYFHGNGKGLYRYGRIGLTNTNSFDYRIAPKAGGRRGTLQLTFRKTGEQHRVPFRITRGDDGARWLELGADPRESGAAVRYRHERGAGPRSVEASPADGDRDSPAGHMWIDMVRYATGGANFHFYQLRDVGIDGRGVGWFHHGDFDDWSTEALTYRLVDGTMEIRFTLRGEQTTTRYRIEHKSDGSRELILHEDPRDFWHEHRYRDAGPSFGMTMHPELAMVSALAGPQPR